ncbi:peptidoglycan-binding protein [Sinosporangium siamense]|uniref:Peptidoglycan-binding protein n=1 Tax=Sinosporangium siamense TaxID=1367973 RepID=A0A919RN63_9ACTN|nr:peptidoglycan-binding protein [Sinosporangium siamense]
MRRFRVIAGLAAGAAIVAAGVIFVTSPGGTTPSAQSRPPETATVTKGQLDSQITDDGTLGYRKRPDGSPYAAVNQARGIYTQLPQEGDKVDCGGTFYRVDNRPVLLLCGDTPAYRDLSIGAEGKDVRQLNQNLKVKGDRFTAKTAQALRKLQKKRGMPVTGKLPLGDAIFMPVSIRVIGVAGRLGTAARAGAEVVQASLAERQVSVDLNAAQQSLVEEGNRVQITLPDNKTTLGKVIRVGAVARRGEGAGAGTTDTTIPVLIDLDRPQDVQKLDNAPVRVEITVGGVKDALIVPVTSVIGRAAGGFAVERVRADGRREIVPVELGLFDNVSGRVQVTGALAEGDRVVVPSI